MTTFVAIDRNWSMGWFSQIHDTIDLGDPNCIEMLYEMTANYLALACYHLSPTGQVIDDRIFLQELLHGYGAGDHSPHLFVGPWRELFFQLAPILVPAFRRDDVNAFDLEPVIDDLGRLSGVCLVDAYL